MHSIASKRNVKYLGVQIDARLHFREHTDLALFFLIYFGKYLNRYGKLGSNKYMQCGFPTNDAEHAVFRCDAWYRLRREVCLYIDVHIELKLDIFMDVMLWLADAWRRVEES